MFLYQTKINGKDGLVAASQTQDAGRQVPIYNEEVLAVLEDDGVLKEDTVAIKEDGDSFKVSISLDQTALTIQTGEQPELTATVTPDDVLDWVEWSSSDPLVASADAMTERVGMVQPLAAGTCTIIASITAEGITKTATCAVTVTG